MPSPRVPWRGPLEFSERAFLATAVIAQWVIVAIFARLARHDGWVYGARPLQEREYTITREVASGGLPDGASGLGWGAVESVVAAPFGSGFADGLPPLVLLQTLLLVPLCSIGLYALVKQLGGTALARAATVVWLVAPLSVALLFDDRYRPVYTSELLPQLLGLTSLDGLPAMTALLWSAYFVFRQLTEERWVFAAAAGVTAGFALCINPTNALYLIAPVACLAVARRGRALGVFALAVLPAVLIAAVWLARTAPGESVAGAVEYALAYDVAFPSAPQGYFSLELARLGDQLTQFREFFWSERLVEWLPLAGLLGAARLAPLKALFLGLWLGAFVLVKGAAVGAPVDIASFWRLILPAWPAYVVLGVSVVMLVPSFRWRYVLRPS